LKEEDKSTFTVEQSLRHSRFRGEALTPFQLRPWERRQLLQMVSHPATRGNSAAPTGVKVIAKPPWGRCLRGTRRRMLVGPQAAEHVMAAIFTTVSLESGVCS